MSTADNENTKVVFPSHDFVRNGIEHEFDRTLPFWKCFLDLRTRYGRNPEVVSRQTDIVTRKPCEVFKGVEVVWAVTRLRMSVALSAEGRKRPRENSNTLATPNKVLQSFTLGTMHFVHYDADKEEGTGYDKSFHIQSVILYENPAQLQCVAGTMLHFGFTMYGVLKLLQEAKEQNMHISRIQEYVNRIRGECKRWTRNVRESAESAHGLEAPITGDVVLHPGEEVDWLTRNTNPQLTNAGALPPADFMDRPATHSLQSCLFTHAANGSGTCDTKPSLTRLCPSLTSRWLILGMGGNSMALALRHLLGPAAELHVVEIELAVVRTCREVASAPESDANLHIHLESAEDALAKIPDDQMDFIILDVFEPETGSMDTSDALLQRCVRALASDGFLWVNDHHLPSTRHLSRYYDLFGAGNVQAVNLHGWNESIIVCRKSRDTALSDLSGQCTKALADVVNEVYQHLLPGWLPPPQWLRSSNTHECPKGQGVTRIWKS